MCKTLAFIFLILCAQPLTFTLIKKTNWIGGWTVFYWAWWIAWSPFVGLFIARISRGRTIKEFIIGVLLVPVGFIMLWMTFFGSSAIDLILNKGMVELGEIVSKDVSMALYTFLEHFPFSSVLSLVATVMIIVFFVTSADSGSMVIDMLCSHGKDDTPVWQRIYWAGGVGLIAVVLLLAGGLDALQTATIAAALPFCIVLLFSIYGLLKALRVDITKQDSLQFVATQKSNTAIIGDWKERLNNIIDYPNKANVQKFIHKNVQTAMSDIAEELEKQEYEVVVTKEDSSVSLEIKLGEEMNFIYQTKVIASVKPSFSQDENEDVDGRDEEELYYRAEVYLQEGGQNYDIMGWSTSAIRNDIIDQYQKHLHFLHLLS